MDAGLRLQACQPVDVSEAFTVPLANLTPSQYAHNVCLHPTKPLMAVAAGTSLAVYDLVTLTRVSRLDMRSIVTEMAFSPDGVVLVLVMQEWVIYGWSMATSRVHLLVPRRDKAEKPLDTCLLAVGGAGRGSIYYCKYGKEAVRRASLSMAEMLDAKGRPLKNKEGSWGAKMRLEPSRAILGLTLVNDGAQLLVLHSDGVLRGYNATGPATDTFNPLFQVQVQEGVTKGLPPPGTLLVVPHPSSPGTNFIIQAARFGGLVSVFQLPAGATMPSLLARSRIPGGGVVLGAGLLQDSQQVVVVVSSQPEGGRLRALSWSLPDRGAGTTSQGGDALGLQPVKVEPMDFSSLLDPRAFQHHQLMPTPPAGPPAVNAATFGHSATARFDTTLGLGSPTSGGGGKPAGDGTGVSGLVHSLWSPVVGWAASVSHAGTLAGGLAPVVSKVVVHRLLPLLAVQLQPSAYMKNTPTYMQLTLSGASADEYTQIRKLLSVPVLNATSWDSILSAGASPAMLAPQHSSLQNWTPSSTTLTYTPLVSPPATPAKPGAATSPAPAPPKPISLPLSSTPHLTLPGAIFYVSDSALCRYSLSSRATTTLAALPEGPTGTSQRVVHQVCFSRAGAWLVFFEQRGVASTAHDRWQWTVVHASDTTAPVWLKPGKFGAFLGPNEEQFAVVDASGKLAAVFSVSTCNQAGASPDYLYSLEGLSSGAHALPIFAGPPRDPVPDPANSAVIGCVMWQSTAGGLAARPLPQVLESESQAAGAAPGGGGGGGGGGGAKGGYSTLGLSGPGGYYRDPNDSSSDGEYDTPRAGEGEGAEGEGNEPMGDPQGTGAVASGANLGPLGPKYWLPLQVGELVLQVSWQSLSWEPTGGSTGITGAADTTTTTTTGAGGKTRKKAGPTMAAVLTNQRVMLVTELLHLHASMSLSDHAFGALPCLATSLLWVGPALMVMLADGRVLQMTWSGAVHAVCSVASDGGRLHLAGATPDSLLMLRGVESRRPGVNSWEVVVRPMSLLQPLVLGWSSLGLLASTSAGMSAVHACRATLKTLLEQMDPQHVTPGLVWALLGTCALDLGYALASHNESVFDPSTYIAAAAAAGDWTAVEKALTLELERAAHHPAPPPRGSASHCKLMAAAGGAVSHGQMQRAVSLLQLAGEWRLALAVATACGDMNLVHSVAAHMASNPSSMTMMEEAGAAQRMATAIRALYGSTVGSVPDSKLQLVGPDGEPCLPEPNAWLLAAPRATINVLVESIDTEGLRADPGESIASAPIEHPLVGALALDNTLKGAINLKALQVNPTDSGRTSTPGIAGQTSTPLQSAGPSTKTVDTNVDPFAASSAIHPLDDIFGLDNLGVQRTATGKDEFASLDTTSQGGSDSDSDLSAAPSPAQQWKGKVTIRDKASAPAAGGDQLREAMKSLKIAPPGTPNALSGGGAFSGTSPALQPTGLSGPSFQGLSPALAAGLTDLASNTTTTTHPQSQPPAFQGLSPALTTGMSFPPPQQQQQPQTAVSEDIDFFFSQFNSTVPTPPKPAQPTPTAGAFQGLSQALAAGMNQAPPPPKPAAGAFQGLSPALAAGMTAPPPAPTPAPATTAAFQGLSPALASGMAQTPPPAPAFQGLSPALMTGMSQPAPSAVPLTSLQGLSPALAASMSQPAHAPAPSRPAPSIQGLSPALAAGMTGPAAPTAIPVPSLQGLSPALAAGMTQAKANIPAPSIQGLSPALAAGMVGTAAAPPAPPPNVPPAGNPDALYHQGVMLLEQGQWAAADEQFSAALAVLKQLPPSASTSGKAAFTSQYLAAVQLLGPASSGAGLSEARLYRYAAALQLDNRHRVPLTKESIARNKQHKNYKYCGDTLTWMVTTLVGTVPDSALTPLQEAIDECERAGNRDAHVPRDEDLETFAQIVGSCMSREDVIRIVGPILTGK